MSAILHKPFHATASAFAQRDDTVVIAGRSAEALEKVATEINAHAVVCAAIVESKRRWTSCHFATYRIIAVDLLGTIYGVKAVLPHFRERGNGVIINVASALADRAVPLLGIYSTAKAGVKAFTDALRLSAGQGREGNRACRRSSPT